MIMDGLQICSIIDLDGCPSKLSPREDGKSYYQFIPVPVPNQLVLFTSGSWPSNEPNIKIDAVISYKDDILQLGTLSPNNRSLSWEKNPEIVPPSMKEQSENGMAKLLLEVMGLRSSECVQESSNSITTTATIETPPPAKGKKKKTDKKLENETTPQINKITKEKEPGSTGKEKKEPNKPVKNKRRTSRESLDNTPTGPTAKKQKTNTRTRKIKSKLETDTPDKNGVNKENTEVLTDITTGNKTDSIENKKKSPSRKVDFKPKVAICKDVTSRAPMPSSRWGHSLCMVHNNVATLVGGQGERQQLCRDSVWSLDPVTRKWKCPEMTSESQKPEYRMGHTATYDPMVRCVYVYGGSKNLKWFHDVHALDVDEWKWQLLKVAGKAPTRAYHSSTLYRHELWIFGGVYPRPDPQPDGCSNDIHIFSPVMENWYAPIVKGEKPLARSGHSATLIKDQLVVFGGWDAPICYSDLHILDMSIVEWTEPKVNGTPPTPRSWHSSCALSGNRILIHGGYNGDLALDDTHIFSLDSLSWMKIKVNPVPTARCGHQALCLPYYHENNDEDEVLIFGGGDNDGAFFNDLFSVGIPFNPEIDNSEKICNPVPPVLTDIDGNVAK